MELLLPMAAKKLDMSFNIEPDVPTCEFIITVRNKFELRVVRGLGRLC